MRAEPSKFGIRRNWLMVGRELIVDGSSAMARFCPIPIKTKQP